MRVFARCALIFFMLSLPGPGTTRAEEIANPTSCDVKLPDWRLDRTPGYSIRNAQMFLYASYVAEWQDKEAIAAQLRQWNLTDIAWIGSARKGVYGFIAEDEEYRLVVFRGTRSIEEGIKDAIFNQASYARIGLPGRGHLGMRLHFQKLYASSRKILESRPPKKLLVAGHSLGGAMAYLHAMKFVQKGWDVEGVYTSGQPRVGDEDLVAAGEAWLGDRYFRMEHELDITARVPPSRDAAQVFASLLPAYKQDLRIELEKFVNTLNYASPRGLTLALGNTLEVVAQTVPQDEINFWAQAQNTLEQAQSVKRVFRIIQSRLQQHPPSAYICRFQQAASAEL